MNAAPTGPPTRKWTWVRWLIAIAVVLIAHLALIYVFGSYKVITPLPVKNASTLELAGGNSSDWLSLNNATLFALPDPNGFAGQMWTELPPFPFRPQKWTEEPQWLDVPSNELVASFTDYVQTNTFAGVHFEFNLPPPLTVPAINQESPFDTNSTLQVVGEVGKRGMLGQMNLPLWPYADVIAPSVVQVLVDAAGNVVSAVLLPAENFSEQSPVRNPDADQYAVRLARTARFAPLAPGAASLSSDPASHLAMGRLVFNWQTVPVTATNAPAQMQ